MIEYFAERDPATDRVLQCLALAHPIEGNPFEPACDYFPLDEPIQWGLQPSPLHILLWNGGALTWVITRTLEQSRDVAIAQTYLDVDAVYEAAVGLRATIYKRSEDAARAYLAAEQKPSPASDLIASYAWHNPTGLLQSELWAAQRIIERADVFLWAEGQMRSVMFARQSDMRAASTHEELDAAVQEWNEFLTWLRGVLGL